MSTLQLNLRNTDEKSKSISFANGQSDVTVTQVSAFIESYNSIYGDDYNLSAAYYQPTVPKTKLFE